MAYQSTENMFQNMKKWLAGKRFESNENFITKTEAYFKELPKFNVSDGLKKL